MLINNSTNSSIASSSINVKLKMPFDIAMMSFGSHGYSETDFKAIYELGYPFFNETNQQVAKSNGTIYYNFNELKDYDVITLNGSLESNKGLNPVKLIQTDKSFLI